MTFNTTPVESPWVTLRRGDPSFQLQGPFTLADRAGIEITSKAPLDLQKQINSYIKMGWIRPVAFVPKDDPTLIWDTLKNGR